MVRLQQTHNGLDDTYSTSPSVQPADNSSGSSYEVRQQRSAEACAEFRERLLIASVSSVMIPSQAVCKVCKGNEANVLCRQCGGQAYFCEKCTVTLYGEINIFHTPIVQEVRNIRIYAQGNGKLVFGFL